MDKKAEIDVSQVAPEYIAPPKNKFSYNPDEGFMSLFKPKEPVYDKDREEKLKRLARVNAFGDFVKNLGAFAGLGYAPVARRPENKNVLRAFAELDKMRDLHNARMDRHNEKISNLGLQDYLNQQKRADTEYNRELQISQNNWLARKEAAQREADRQFRKEQQKGAQDFTTAENAKNRAHAKEMQGIRSLGAIASAEAKNLAKEPFLTVTLGEGKEARLTRSDAIAIGNKAVQMWRDLPDENLKPQDKKLKEDINLLLRGMSMDEKVSDNAIRVFAEKYYPTVVEKHPELKRHEEPVKEEEPPKLKRHEADSENTSVEKHPELKRHEEPVKEEEPPKLKRHEADSENTSNANKKIEW